MKTNGTVWLTLLKSSIRKMSVLPLKRGRRLKYKFPWRICNRGCSFERQIGNFQFAKMIFVKSL